MLLTTAIKLFPFSMHFAPFCLLPFWHFHISLCLLHFGYCRLGVLAFLHLSRVYCTLLIAVWGFGRFHICVFFPGVLPWVIHIQPLWGWKVDSLNCNSCHLSICRFGVFILTSCLLHFGYCRLGVLAFLHLPLAYCTLVIAVCLLILAVLAFGRF